MVRRTSGTVVLAFLLAVPLATSLASAREKDPKPLEPLASLKPHESKPGEGDGYFDEVFGLDDAGKQLAVIRGDGATFSRIETYDLEAKPPKLTASFEPPSKSLIVTRVEVLPPGKGMVLIGRDRPDDSAPLTAYLIDATGRSPPRSVPRQPSAGPPATARPGPPCWSPSIASSADTARRPPTLSHRTRWRPWRPPASHTPTRPTWRVS
jgi:hypothetical protein